MAPKKCQPTFAKALVDAGSSEAGEKRCRWRTAPPSCWNKQASMILQNIKQAAAAEHAIYKTCIPPNSRSAPKAAKAVQALIANWKKKPQI